jgi:hypothetical protein
MRHFTLDLCFSIRWDLRVTSYISVGLGHESSTQYYLCSVGLGMDSTKSVSGHVTPNLCVLYPVGSAVHVVHSGASGE